MTRAKQALEREHYRSIERRRLLHLVKERLERSEVVDAVGALALIVELLSDSEDRVMQVHSECVAMLEQAGKILELDAMRRPTIIQMTAPVQGVTPEGSNGQ